MPSTKVGESKLIVKNAASELDQKPPSKFMIRCCDLMILGASFMFTILVACCLLHHINHSHLQSAAEIEKIVEKILDSRSLKPATIDTPNFERKRGYLDEAHGDESSRSKRDYRSQTNGELLCSLRRLKA